MSLSNDPLIIVDGIRVNNASNGGASFNIGVGGQQINRLDDFNPEEVENIDIIKGPAAAALYGTAAANGVIQITTKKGRAGRTNERRRVGHTLEQQRQQCPQMPQQRECFTELAHGLRRQDSGRTERGESRAGLAPLRRGFRPGRGRPTSST